MSTYTVGTLVDVVEKKALDENNDDFSQAQLIGYYNLALRLIISLVPRAYTITSQPKLSAGIAQSIPADGLSLVNVIMNMGTDGETVGSPINEVSLDAINKLVPGWTVLTAATEIEDFIRIPQMDAMWYCCPPSDGLGYVQQEYSAMPPATTYDADGDWEDDKIPFSDEFIPALPDAMLFHAYDFDSDTPGTAPRSQMYYQRALTLLKIKGQQWPPQRRA